MTVSSSENGSEQARLSDRVIHPPGAGGVVDVVIPCYNAEHTIRQTLLSVLTQSLARFRLIIVDDGSTDGTGLILDEFARSDDRVQVVRMAHDGVVAASNRALELCTAEFVARLDADDIAFPQRLERQVAYLRENPDCVAVSSACYHIYEDGRRTGYVVALDPPDQANPFETPSREPYLMHPFLMARREAMVRVGGYRHVDYAEDTDLYWRLQEIGRLAVMPDILGEYRLHARSVSSNSVVNGRVAAINSQLAGLSAIRRRSGRPDIEFVADDLARLKQLSTLSAMYDDARARTSQDEWGHLRLSVATKLLELSAFRPYELEASDCDFIRAAVQTGLPGLAGRTRAHVKGEWIHGGARLLSKGLLKEYRQLITREVLAATILRAVRLRLESLFPAALIIELKRRSRLLRTRLRRSRLTLAPASDSNP